ncbi:MAG TPA: HEAT repeat domain-containing protein [Cyclobacteriaceae bacterium]|nr:HEAT repeat domain-containing protein [Cyclobacteriaceae bacterium]
MSFYTLSKSQRLDLVEQIKAEILLGLQKNNLNSFVKYFSDEDTYIRKSGYLVTGRIYLENIDLQKKIIAALNKLLKEDHHSIRQTVINAAGEIGKKDFDVVESFFDRGMFDEHHTVRNAVIGSIKKMGEKSPKPVLKWAKKYLHHPDKEIRREVCHGIELRGRTHPQDILPLLKELQFDKTARVRKTLVHVLGQISYKKGCLETVIADLNSWGNKALTNAAIEEIIDVHDRYKDFAILSQKQAIDYIQKHYKK